MQQLEKRLTDPNLEFLILKWAFDIEIPKYDAYDEYVIKRKKIPPILYMRLICKNYAYGEFCNSIISLVKHIHIKSLIPDIPVFWKNKIQFVKYIIFEGFRYDMELPKRYITTNLKKVEFMFCDNIGQIDTFHKAEWLNIKYGSTYINDFGKYKSIKILQLNTTCIKNITGLNHVEDLELSHCRNLTDIKNLDSMKKIKIYGCELFNDLSALLNIHTIELSFMSNIVNVDVLRNIPVLKLMFLNNLINVNSLTGVKQLTLQSLGKITNIDELVFNENIDISCMSGIRNLDNLKTVRKLSITSFDKDISIDALYTVKNLELSNVNFSNINKFILNYGRFHQLHSTSLDVNDIEDAPTLIIHYSIDSDYAHRIKCDINTMLNIDSKLFSSIAVNMQEHYIKFTV